MSYKMCYVDADTALFRCAKSCQEDYIIVKHKTVNWEKEFRNVTEFYGTKRKTKDGGWIELENKNRAIKNKPPISYEMFDIFEHSRLLDEKEKVLDQAVENFDRFVGKIKKHSEAEDYKLCIGGEGNWRYEVATILPYKGNRKAKPLLFLEFKERIIDKYKNKIIVVDNREVDDYLGIVGFKNYQNYLKTKQWDNVLSFVDKDLQMIISPHFNYDKIEEGITITTPTLAAQRFCSQLLSGDKSTDNIQGLPTLTRELQEKYKLRKVNGIGKDTANKLVEGKSIKECFELVVECYKAYYGEDKKEFVSFSGVKYQYNWLDYIKENALLLFMQRSESEFYDIEDTFKRLKINY